jgi:hypothetical protein
VQASTLQRSTAWSIVFSREIEKPRSIADGGRVERLSADPVVEA